MVVHKDVSLPFLLQFRLDLRCPTCPRSIPTISYSTRPLVNSRLSILGYRFLSVEVTLFPSVSSTYTYSYAHTVVLVCLPHTQRHHACETLASWKELLRMFRLSKLGGQIERWTAGRISTRKLGLSVPCSKRLFATKQHCTCGLSVVRFGVCLYLMFTGQLPFTSTEPLQLVHAHISKQPQAPIDLWTQKWPQLDRDSVVGPALSAIIMKLLAKNKEDRLVTIQHARCFKPCITSLLSLLPYCVDTRVHEVYKLTWS